MQAAFLLLIGMLICFGIGIAYALKTPSEKPMLAAMLVGLLLALVLLFGPTVNAL